MVSITVAIAMTTFVLFLFPATRIFGTPGALLLAYLFPVTFAVIAAIGLAVLAYFHWTKP